MSLKLHPIYGMNPTMRVCFFCGMKTGEVMPMGYNNNQEAPRESITDYVPCKRCQAVFKKGTLLIEVQTESPDGRPPIQDGYYPTGRFLPLRTEWAAKEFKMDKPPKLAFVDKEAFDTINPSTAAARREVLND